MWMGFLWLAGILLPSNPRFCMGRFSFQMKLQLSALPVNEAQTGQVWGSGITEIEPEKSSMMGALPVICVYLNRSYYLDN